LAAVTRKAAFTWDALGRRIEFINDKLGGTSHYYYDGVNELVEDNQSDTRQRYCVHGVSYVDERLCMQIERDVLDRLRGARVERGVTAAEAV